MMGSAPDINNENDSTDVYQEAVQTFKDTHEICQRLEKWSMKGLADPFFSRPILDLARYCTLAIEQFNFYLTDQKPLLQSKFIQEQLRRGLWADGNECGLYSNEDDMAILQFILGKCKKKLSEVLDLQNQKLTQISENEKPTGRRGWAEPKTDEIYNYRRYFAAVEAVRKNNAMRSDTQYMLEKSRRVEQEAETHILPDIFAFGDELSAVLKNGHLGGPSANDPFPERILAQEVIDKFLCLSTGCAERLGEITDSLNVKFYNTTSDVPYKETAGATVGRGSFGSVYRAQYINTQAVVAIKELRGIDTSRDRATVRKELNMLQMCNHPNIVKLVDAYQIYGQQNTFYLVICPWAPYTLNTFLNETDSKRRQSSPWFTPGSPDTEQHVLRIFRGLADGLSYLHDRSIKHKDLKPDNILLRSTSHGVLPIITDLGLSKICARGNPTRDLESTYAFLAPEQIRESGTTTLRSDVWQLGCCFAFMLAAFQKGSVGWRLLWGSFDYTDGDCSCNIALEAQSFMRTFRSLCGHGSPSGVAAYWLTTAMLELDPERRCVIKEVRRGLGGL